MGSKKKINNGKAEEKTDEKTIEKELIFYLIIAVFAILMLPYIIRFLDGNTALIGSQPYYHMGVAESMLRGNFEKDSLVYGSRDLAVLPYHFVLAGAGYFLGADIASKAVPFVLGVLSLVLFYQILKELKVDSVRRFVVALLLIISPPYIHLFTVSTPNSLSVFLILLGMFLFLRKKMSFYVLSVACFAIVAISSVFTGILTSLMLLYLAVIDEANKTKSFVAFVIMAGVYFMHPSAFYYNFELSRLNIMGSFVSGLGAMIGFSIFIVILAMIGIFYSWKDKGRLYPLYIALLFLTVSMLYIGEEANLYTNFFVIILAAMGLERVKKIKWEFEVVRYLVFVIIGCGLLFTTISYMNRLPNIMPDRSMAEGLVWLNNNSNPNQLVVSHPSRGYLIEAMAGRTALIDDYSASLPGFNKKSSDLDGMFYNIDLDDTIQLFRKYNVSYLLIDEEMRNGLVWEKEKEGLLFLLRNNKTFRKVYGSETVDIWEVYGIY